MRERRTIERRAPDEHMPGIRLHEPPGPKKMLREKRIAKSRDG